MGFTILEKYIAKILRAFLISMGKKFTLFLLLSIMCSKAILAQNTVVQDTVVVFGIPMVIERDTVNYWKTSGNINLNIQQIGLINWTAGGESSLGFGTVIEGDAVYENDNTVWNNTLRLAYGLLRQGNDAERFEKTDDNLLIRSRYSQKFSKSILMSSQLLFRTQMDPGFKNESVPGGGSRRVLISDFMAPGYLQASHGLTYREGDEYDITLSPFSGRFTFVLNDSLANAGSFGVEPGQMVRAEAGISLTGTINKQIVENVKIRVAGNLFSNYERFPSTVVNLLATFDFTVNEYIGATISSQLIYDEDVIITFDDGSQGPGVQLKNVINLGFNLKL
jgi:hypothetical protein